ncbi:E3 ubiquitin-protein ligase [Tolypocladium ophioglossoides CBS 100239]|uniref:E3 ubiquitin-protein ligase n=1 Tax=Tolypocladium ophioglossoides (strain CBS 100239) TaxID=1163406 RepID=A0A0L0N7A7_TOLOC|nr:E3 ubiquitin-protein ligase [Tolypocladium ophioglossoides CBS 100239]
MDDEVFCVDREVRNACIRKIVAVFPDVCVQYVMTIMEKLGCGADADTIINHLVDQEEAGKPYQRVGAAKDLKRKRTADDDDAEEEDRAKRTYLHPGRAPRALGSHHVEQIRNLISADYPQVPAIAILAAMTNNRDHLFPAYVAVYEMLLERDDGHPWKSQQQLPAGRYAPENIEQRILASADSAERETLMELRAARRKVAFMERKHRAKLELERAEKANFDECQAKGLVKECECCFMDYATNRLVHCNGETAHWFCFKCAYNQAKELSGLTRYELTCMSTDGCEAGFSHSERHKFLDEKLATALDKIEQEAVLRLTDIEGLVHCPFCPFAAVCGPATEDKEFRCQRPECRKVSCRLCNEETHIPLSCEEAKRDRRAFSARHTVEEARSEALIRKCNKCGTPFIKEHGCNKMRCPRAGCHNLQCYVCSQNCDDYQHFNDAARGGRRGNCPLFDDSEMRHARDADNAEQETLKKMTATNPDIDPELLKFRMSDEVNRNDEAKRRGGDIDNLQPPGAPAPAPALAPQPAPQPAPPVPRQPVRQVVPLQQAQQRAIAVNQRIERENQAAPQALRLAYAVQQPPPLPHWLQYIPRIHREAAARQWTRNLPFLGGAGYVARADNVPRRPPRRQPRRAAVVARQAVHDLFNGVLREDHIPRAAQDRPANQATPAVQAAGGLLAQAQRPVPAGQVQQVAVPVAHAAPGVVGPGAPIAPEIRRFPASQQEWDSMYRRGLLPRQQNPPAPGYTGRQPWLAGYGMSHLPPWRMASGLVTDPTTGNLVPRYPPGAILYGNGGVWYGEPSNMRQIGKDAERNV